MTYEEVLKAVMEDNKVKFRHKMWPEGVYVEQRRNQLVYSKSSMRFSSTSNYYNEASCPNDYFLLNYEGVGNES